ncbi:SOS response-associated peptidase [Paraburkholderia lacunae]|nr:SOS response-associated peptidase family protein [Paraburkholderia lacunae]
MCVRYVRTGSGPGYVAPFSTDNGQSLERLDIYSPTWNAAPGTRQLVIYPDCIIRSLNWGCRPPGFVPLRLPKIVTSRAENVAYSPFLKALWRSGRVIVPADSWYEWIGTDDGVRQPYAILPKRSGPLFLAGVANLQPDNEAHDDDGFIVITSAARSGLFDVHGRSPLIFAVDAARKWLDPAASAREIEDIARNGAVPAEEFEWFQVSPAVNRVGNDGAELVKPV